MKEYIEREAAIKDLEKRRDARVARSAILAADENEIIRYIKTLPAADVVPVRHGRWVFNDELDDMFHCTVCDNVAVRNTFNYCPHCGADMREETE